MTSPTSTPHPNENPGIAGYLSLIAISSTASAACWWAAGDSLGLFIGGLMIATFLIPPIVLQNPTGGPAAAGFALVLLPVAIVWFGAVMKGADPFPQWAACVLVLATYALALAGIALLLARAGISPIFASAAAVILGLAWLTWPIWLCDFLLSRGLDSLAGHLVRFSPPLTINGILTGEPAWTERSLAYQLTNLNQDIPIVLPGAPWMCAAAHGVIGLVLCSLAFVRRRPRKSPIPDVLNSPAARLE
jgi:hypothetical protein